MFWVTVMAMSCHEIRQQCLARDWDPSALDVPFEAGQVLRYHIATTAGTGRLSLWVEVRSPHGKGETLATQLKPVPGQSLSAGRLVTYTGGYNLGVCSQERELLEPNP